MENTTKTLLESCSELTMEELEQLSFTKIIKEKDGESDFLGLGILDKNGYLLEYDQLKVIYAGLNHFIRHVNPELIKKMNQIKYQEDQKEKQKDQLLNIVSKNIVDMDEWEQSEEKSFFQRIFHFFTKR
ncbi:hypothetical protein [Garciella nitratireducens]|uniref:Uncharacterized protein n=1 Tax=Garciella nitratireducens DSM 15102 TaxID=1121911 RepID=A0A1T4NBR4_9FIRM|nr:hypothetical protein [Garciella nitratireducens]RBP44061.1 hypothetical protein DFR81_1052 [Garciella nitratireducens]SJZ76516.1 hypothetical protein SAMN02745973_01621 [Garciella nitratireducens DSM 15102]